jgi:hypothetical protein
MEPNAEDRSPSDTPRISWWRWLTYAVSALVVLRTTFRATYYPWAWTTDQVLFVGFLVVATLLLFVWWWRGSEGFDDTFAKARALRANSEYKSINRWSYAFWIAVAVALVVYFNMKTGH